LSLDQVCITSNWLGARNIEAKCRWVATGAGHR
jgi:hypothetical protein